MIRIVYFVFVRSFITLCDLVRANCVANRKFKIFFVFFDGAWFANLLRLFMLCSLLLSRPAEQHKRLGRYCETTGPFVWLVRGVVSAGARGSTHQVRASLAIS